MLELSAFFVFCAGLVLSSYEDIRTMEIPNWISIALVLSFPVFAFSLGYSWAFIGWSFLAGLIGLAICIALFSLNVFGGGDAKLLPAVLIWVGPDAYLEYVYGIALSGGALAIAIILSRRFVPASYVPSVLQRSVVQGPGIPYAVAIAFGAFWAVPASPFLNQVLPNFL